jgi:hypothetical protein
MKGLHLRLLNDILKKIAMCYLFSDKTFSLMKGSVIMLTGFGLRIEHMELSKRRDILAEQFVEEW